MNDDTIKLMRAFSYGKYEVKSFSDRTSWLKGRCNTIGASEAAAVIGKSPWMNEVELWERKRGKEVKENTNASMSRGTRSEAHIRELYGIEMGVHVFDGTNIMLVSKEYPFMSCSLDGFYIDPRDDNCIGDQIKPIILEIKSAQKNDSWNNDTIPEHYLIQILHQFAVTGWEKAVLRARFFASPNYPLAVEKSYVFLRKDYEQEIDSLICREMQFWETNVKGDKRPSVKMPSI